SQRWLRSAWRNTPPLPPSADFTAPTNTWWTVVMLSSPPSGLNCRQDHTPRFVVGNTSDVAARFGGWLLRTSGQVYRTIGRYGRLAVFSSRAINGLRRSTKMGNWSVNHVNSSERLRAAAVRSSPTGLF